MQNLLQIKLLIDSFEDIEDIKIIIGFKCQVDAVQIMELSCKENVLAG